MSKITVASFATAAGSRWSGSTAYLRIYYYGSNPAAFSFSTDEVWAPSVENFYREIACTLASNVVTVPTTILDSTPDITNRPDVFCRMVLLDSARNEDSQVLLADRWDIPISLGSTVTFEQLRVHNETPITRFEDRFSLSRTAIEELIAANNTVGGLATTTVAGRGKLSTAAADAANPIFVGDNDTRVPTQAENDALQGTSGTPSNANRFVTDADSRLIGSAVTSSTRAGLPAAGTFGRLRFLTDAERGIAYDNGATYNNWPNLLKTYDAQRWGLKADGSTDDSSALQTAIAAVSALGGGRIILPAGSIKLQSVAFGTAEHVFIEGQGTGTIIRNPSAGNDTFTLGTSGAALAYRCGIRDVSFYPSVTRTVGAAGPNEIKADFAHHVYFERLKFTAANRCIKLGDASALTVVSRIVDIRVDDVWSVVKLVRHLQAFMRDIGGDMARATGVPIGIHFDGGVEGCTLQSADIVNTLCYLEGPNGATTGGATMLVDADEYTATDAAHNFVENAFLDSSTDGLNAVDGRDFKFTNCWFNGTQSRGATLAATTDGYTFNACTFWFSGDAGCVLLGANHRVVDSDAVSNGTRGAAPVKAGIYLGSTHTRVRGNRCMNGWGGGNGQVNGIVIDPPADQFIVTDNDCQGNTSTSIVNNVGTGAARIVTNNIT